MKTNDNLIHIALIYDVLSSGIILNIKMVAKKYDIGFVLLVAGLPCLIINNDNGRDILLFDDLILNAIFQINH